MTSDFPERIPRKPLPHLLELRLIAFPFHILLPASEPLLLTGQIQGLRTDRTAVTQASRRLALASISHCGAVTPISHSCAVTLSMRNRALNRAKKKAWSKTHPRYMFESMSACRLTFSSQSPGLFPGRRVQSAQESSDIACPYRYLQFCAAHM